MKHFAVLTFAVVAALCIAMSQSVSSQYGYKGFHDVLMDRQYFIKKFSWWQKCSKDVEYPPPGYHNSKVITAVYAIDQTGGKNTSTGYASVLDGGIGFTFLKMHLKGPYGCALNFTVDIYGRDKF